MKIEEFKEKAADILKKHLDGEPQDTLEEFISEVQKDYEEREKSGTGEKGNEWKDKYTELKEKYVQRFFNGKEDEKEVTEELTEEEKKKEENNKTKEEKEERMEEIKTKDLFKEKEE